MELKPETVTYAWRCVQATLHYLEELQPATINTSLDPDALRPKALAALAFVWLYILGYMWRGLFKAGFRESPSLGSGVSS